MAPNRILEEAPTEGAFAIGRKACLVLRYSGLTVATIALVLGGAALTWPGRLAGGASFLLSLVVAFGAESINRSTRLLGQISVDAGGITRRSWFRSQRVEWSEIERARTGLVTVRNLASAGRSDAAGLLAASLDAKTGGLGGDDWFIELGLWSGDRLFIDGADTDGFELARRVLRAALAEHGIPLEEETRTR